MLSKTYIKKIQALHLKKNRLEQGLFIAEGPKLAEEILHSAIKVIEVIAEKNWIAKNRNFVKHSANIVEAGEEDLKKISTLSTPNQVLLICETPVKEINYQLISKEMTLYLDDIRDPGNLGTIIRIADWFGVSQVICSPNSTELYSPKTIQSSMGSITRINAVVADISSVLNELENQKIKIPLYGAVLDGDNIYQQKNLHPGLLVIGNESNGISQNVISSLTHRIKIPSSSKNGAESLNAAVATSLIVAEFFRRKEYC